MTRSASNFSDGMSSPAHLLDCVVDSDSSPALSNEFLGEDDGLCEKEYGSPDGKIVEGAITTMISVFYLSLMHGKHQSTYEKCINSISTNLDKILNR